MLSFKQFLKGVYLVEATAKHFPFLDADNEYHKKLIDAYNMGHSANDLAVPRNPSQIKSIEQLEDVVQPHLKKINQKEQEDKDDKASFDRGDATLVHHDPESKLKIYRVDSQPGSVAALKDIGKTPPWCTAKRYALEDVVRKYAPGGNAFIIHNPKAKEPNMRVMGIYGREHGNTRQDIQNHYIDDAKWNQTRRELGLDKIKYLQGSIGSIPLSNENREKYENELSNSIKNNTAKSEDIIHAIHNDYLSNNLRDNLLSNTNTSHVILHNLAVHNEDSEVHSDIINHPNVNTKALNAIANNSYDSEVHKMLLNHPKINHVTINNIAKNTDDPEIFNAISNHPKASEYAKKDALRSLNR